METIDNKTGEVIPTSMQALAAQSGPTNVAVADGEVGGTQFAMTKAEIDQQIATAKRYPRDVRQCRDQITSLVTIDEEMASECVYALKRGGKVIKGPSIRLAEIVASQWKNARYGARIVEVDRVAKTVTAEGFFNDLEQNVAVAKRITRNIQTREGKLYNDDMITMTGNVAGQIAMRNAILTVVPKSIWRSAYYAAEDVIAGDVKTLGERRDKAVKAFAVWGVDSEQISAYLGVNSIEDVTLDDVVALVSIYTSIKNGDEDVDEFFPPIESKKSRKVKGDIDKKIEKSAEKKKAEPEVEKETKAKEPEEEKQPEPEAKKEPEESSKTDVESDEAVKGAASGGPEEASEQEVTDEAAPAESVTSENTEDDKLATAEKRGRAAAENGLSPRATPKEYRGDDTLLSAWEKGFRERTDELKGAQS